MVFSTRLRRNEKQMLVRIMYAFAIIKRIKMHIIFADPVRFAEFSFIIIRLVHYYYLLAAGLAVRQRWCLRQPSRNTMMVVKRSRTTACADY